jgi:hypothetical protein
VGLDIGQQRDNAALAAVRVEYPQSPTIMPYGIPQGRPNLICPALKRWPLGTSYLKIASDVANFANSKWRHSCLWFDATGPGAVFKEILWRAFAGRANSKIVAVTVTGGLAFTDANDGTVHLSKIQLVSAFNMVLQSRRLFIAKNHPEAATLRREMTCFKVKTNAQTGAESFGAIRKDHDDLLFALMLASFAAGMMV